ncbi:hypothetical protein H4R18_005533 [Coemansia javaensis]|uniref:Uncharacterized protein n=1 Tax=Coemansia javaensis TaxID=2761396 RepID=A0A9W8H193_9FUNG|nr:hypothetical protein H4R18_005533 [Coemansia javaensis]
MLTSPPPRSGRWSRPARAFLAAAAAQAAAGVALEAALMARAGGALQLVHGAGLVAVQAAALLLAAAAMCVRSEALTTTAAALDVLLLALRAALLLQPGARASAAALHACAIAALALGGAAKAWLAWRHLRRDFGWQMFRALGADLRMRRMLVCQQLLLSLAVLAALLFLHVWVQLAGIAALTGAGALGWVLSAALLAAVVAVLCACLAAAVRELRWLMYACAALFAAAPAPMVYMLVVVATRWRLARPAGAVHAACYKYMALLLAALLALDIALALASLAVARTFGKGLKERLRHFQDLARQDIDLEAATAPGTLGPHAPSAAAEDYLAKPAPARQPASGALARALASTRGSLWESSVLFRAFFFGLDVADGPEARASTEAPPPPPPQALEPSAHPTMWLLYSVPKFSATSLQNMFASPCSTTCQASPEPGAARPPQSPAPTERSSLCLSDAALPAPGTPSAHSAGSARSPATSRPYSLDGVQTPTASRAASFDTTAAARTPTTPGPCSFDSARTPTTPGVGSVGSVGSVQTPDAPRLCSIDSVRPPPAARLCSIDSIRLPAATGTPMTLELLLSIEELDTINGELVAAASRSYGSASGSRPHMHGAAGSPAPSWSLVSSASLRTSTGTAPFPAMSPGALVGERSRVVFRPAAYADDYCPPPHAVHSPLALRVTNSSDIVDCSDDSRPASRPSSESRTDTLGSAHTDAGRSA